MTPTLLFVHSPLVGPSTWQETANMLRGKGFRCEVPDLTAIASEGPPFYPRLATAAAQSVPGQSSSVLIGHSAAGALLPAIAEAIAGPVQGVFVDAMLPHPAVSWFDTAPPPLREQLMGMADRGVLPPWHEWFPPSVVEDLLPDPSLRRMFCGEIPRLPVAYFEERARETGHLGGRWAYLRFSAAYDSAADEAEKRGWWVARRDWDHLRMITAPEDVADLLSQAISAVSTG